MNDAHKAALFSKTNSNTEFVPVSWLLNVEERKLLLHYICFSKTTQSIIWREQVHGPILDSVPVNSTVAETVRHLWTTKPKVGASE